MIGRAHAHPGNTALSEMHLLGVVALTISLGAGLPAAANESSHSTSAPKAVVLPPAPPLALGPAPLVDMVRELKLAQNRLAFGDEGAIKVSQEQVNSILAWLENAPVDTWLDRRNIRALAVFLLGGGSIGSARAPLKEAKIDASDRILIDNVLAYVDGRFDETLGLKSIDALKLESILGAHVALAQATLLAAEAPQKAYDLMTQSALLAPGTLIEEAVLRRQIVMAAGKRGTGNLPRVLEVYVRRFPHSIYRRGLVDALVNAVGRRDFETKDEILGVNTAVQVLAQDERSRIGLLLAESQIAHGHLEWARELADQTIAATAEGSGERVRAKLYRAVSDVFNGGSGQAAAVFDTIDPQVLSAGDETLLRAAKEVTQAVVATASFDPNNAGEAFETPAIANKARALLSEADKLLSERR